jgi:hypothetical protein
VQKFKVEWLKGTEDSAVVLTETDLPESTDANTANAAAKKCGAQCGKDISPI